MREKEKLRCPLLLCEASEIRTPNLLIWSQTRCRCAIAPSAHLRFCMCLVWEQCKDCVAGSEPAQGIEPWTFSCSATGLYRRWVVRIWRKQSMRASRAASRQRGDSNPCGQSPVDFKSISLAARTHYHVLQMHKHDIATAHSLLFLNAKTPLNPGLPRDRRKYQPLYYHGLACVQVNTNLTVNKTRCQKKFVAKQAKARRAFEPRLPDSESEVLTVTPPGQILTSCLLLFM